MRGIDELTDLERAKTDGECATTVREARLALERAIFVAWSHGLDVDLSLESSLHVFGYRVAPKRLVLKVSREVV